MCIKPITIKTTPNPVPCGKCSECKARRVSGWSFRLQQQEKISISSHFVTLTYDGLTLKSDAQPNLTITDKGFMDLNRRDVQLFLKRLRKLNHKIRGKLYPIRYYCAGEYGGKTRRPHYHLILYNCDPSIISTAWGLGQIHIGQSTGASIGYTLKYITKDKTVPQHKNDDRTPEFSLMSKGLGKNYLSSEIIRWHKMDIPNRMYLNIAGGTKASMPRYYKDKLYTDTERETISTAARLKSDSFICNTPLHDLLTISAHRKIVFMHDLYCRKLPTKDNL